MAQLKDTVVNGNLEVTGLIKGGGLDELIILVNYNDETPRTISAHSGINVRVTFPTYDQYKLIGCVGGHAGGASGIVVQNNKWLFNPDTVDVTISNIIWYLLYIRNV